MNYEDFDRLSKYRFLPDMHLYYLIPVTFITLLLLYYDVIMIGVGNILLNDFVENTPLVMIIGLVCALSEAVIVDLVLQKTEPTSQKEKNNKPEGGDS